MKPQTVNDAQRLNHNLNIFALIRSKQKKMQKKKKKKKKLPDAV